MPRVLFGSSDPTLAAGAETVTLFETPELGQVLQRSDAGRNSGAGPPVFRGQHFPADNFSQRNLPVPEPRFPGCRDQRLRPC